jgi:hypothetical protein
LPGGHLLFLFTHNNFNGVHELTAKGYSVLDEKSKQKNQAKIIPAFTHKSA